VPDLLPLSDKRDKTHSAAKPKKTINSIFSEKKFYLDLRAKSLGLPEVKQIVADLQTLGGVRNWG
jgi:hypothetical protein